jgi:hypothetical protein
MTVAVFTSSEQPGSTRFWSELNASPWARENRGLVQLVQVSKDANTDRVQQMGIGRFPTVVVYARGAGGVMTLGQISDCDSSEGMTRWLRALELAPGRGAQGDASVTPTNYGGDVYPSQQYTQPSPPPMQAPPQPQMQPQPQPSVMMSVAQPIVSSSAAVVQVPSQNLMIQQAPPQVFLAPQPQPVVYVPQVQSAPMTAAPTGNLFLAAPSVAAPAPAPTMATAPAAAPVASAVPATMAVAAPVSPALTLNNQTLSLPSTGTRTRVHVRGPGLLGSSLARFGERLTQLGRTRIHSVQETTLEAPAVQSPGGGLTTISTTSAAPVVSQPTTSTMILPVPEQPVCQHVCQPPCRHRAHLPCQHEAPPQYPPQPPPYAPSPQSATGSNQN